MINITEEIVSRHKDKELIEFLHHDLFQVQKLLEASIAEQNLMSIGSIMPVIERDVNILKSIKKRNDELDALKNA